MKSWILSHPVKAIGIAALILMCSFVAFKIVSFVRDPFGPATIIREEAPLTVNQARAKDCPIPLPDSAKNVEFAYYSEWINLEILVRFQAPADDCRAYAQQLVNAEAKEQKRPSVKISFDPVTSPPKFDPEVDLLGPVPWFDIKQMSQGMTAIVPIGNYAQIWIDDKRGVFYYRQTD
jgi:hypothetical protein